MAERQGSKHKIRHDIDLEHLNASVRHLGYTKMEAAVQLPIFHFNSNPDRNARLDGNAFLICKTFEKDQRHKILLHDMIHLSPFRNAHRLKVQLSNGRILHLVNTHLHHEIEEGAIRHHQIRHLLYWLEQTTEATDIVMLMGDFNINGDKYNYDHII